MFGCVCVSCHEHNSVNIFREMQKMNQLRMELREKLVDNGIHWLDVGRVSIVEKDIRVKFRGERGVDAGGLSRELFPAFWESACTQVFDGRIEKIPVLTPDNAEVFHLLGLILSHGFVLTGFFPMYFAKTMTNTLVCNEEKQITTSFISLSWNILIYLSLVQFLLAMKSLTHLSSSISYPCCLGLAVQETPV